MISMTTLPMTGDGGVFTSVEDLFLWDQNFYDNKLGNGGQALIKKIQRPGILNSGELDTAYILRLKKGKLYVQHENPHRNSPQATLKPIFKDRFEVEGWKLNFIRNEKKDIVGFRVNAGRVQNILFEKE